MKSIHLMLVLTVSILSGVSCDASRHNYDSVEGLVLAGYQGWFNAEDDGAGLGWKHYQKNNEFYPGCCSIDLWPDVSEYEKTYPTDFRMADGSVAEVFSSHDRSTTMLHFKWMEEYGIDGVFMQRFVTSLRTEKGKDNYNHILSNALDASDKYGRAICVMYDLSGISSDETWMLEEDWKELQDSCRITERANYLHHNGKPLVAVWGAGFNDNRKYGNEDVDRLVEEGLDAIEEIYWPISKWGRHHIILKDGSLSFNNVSLPQKDTSDTRRLELRDTAGDLISAYDKFPAIDEEWKRDMMYINDYVAVSPDEEKFAVVTSLGGILETFSIKDGELKNIATKYFVEPDFSMTKSKVGEVYSVSYDYDNLVKSFGDLYVTNDAVYAVYGGDRMFTSRTGSDNIAVFDWKGNPQKLIRTDYRIVTFFLDEEENTVYAVIWDSEMRPYIGRIRI